MPYETLSGDFAGIALAVLTLVGAFALAQMSTSTTAGQISFLAAIYVRVLLSALSAFGLFLPAESDRLDFHVTATALASGAINISDISDGSKFYVSILSWIYAVFGSSIFLGNGISVVAFGLSLHFLLKTARLLGYRNSDVVIILFFSFSPAMLIYANYTYREPLQILFLVLSIYNALLYRRSSSLLRLCVMIIFLGAFAFMHQAFFIVTPFIFLAAVFFRRSDEMPGRPRRRSRRGPIGVLVTVSVIFFAGVVFARSFSNLKFMQIAMEGNVAEALNNTRYVMLGIVSRTLLPYRIENDTIFELVWKSPFIYFQFLFAPILPWIVTARQDLVALVDTGIRTILLFSAWREIRTTRDWRKREFIFLLAIYLAFTLLGALGTTTVGTAMRHQIKISWILVLLGAPRLWGLMRPVQKSKGRAIDIGRLRSNAS